MRSDIVQFRYARDLQRLKRYFLWRNFQNVGEAHESRKRANHTILDHFVGVSKSIPVLKDSERIIDDIRFIPATVWKFQRVGFVNHCGGVR